MKILAVSDLHFSLSQFDWVSKEAGNFDVVIIAGDLLDIAGHLDLDSQIIVVAKYLRAISAKTRLVVCSGNHDGDVKNEHQEFIARWLQRLRNTGLAVDGESVEIHGVRLSVCPWWDGPATRASMQLFLEREALKPRMPWLWVHHAPPDKLPICWNGKQFAGDHYLNQLIDSHRPDLVFSGHIHNSPFWNGGAWAARQGTTWAFNAGRQMGAPPSFIVVDLTMQTARWCSQAGDEEISLS